MYRLFLTAIACAVSSVGAEVGVTDPSPDDAFAAASVVCRGSVTSVIPITPEYTIDEAHNVRAIDYQETFLADWCYKGDPGPRTIVISVPAAVNGRPGAGANYYYLAFFKGVGPILEVAAPPIHFWKVAPPANSGRGADGLSQLERDVFSVVKGSDPAAARKAEARFVGTPGQVTCRTA